MKKILKNIIISASIIYFILSIGSSIFIREELKYSLLSLEKIDEKMMLYGQTTEQTAEKEWISFRNGQIYILEDNLRNAVISIVIGTFIAILLSSKENSIVKYILFFILGAIVYNLIWTIVICLVNLIVGNTWIHFLEVFEKPAIGVIISYIPIYIVLFMAYMSHKKRQVDELNETLRNKNKKFTKININIDIIKKIAIITLAVAVIIMIIIGGNLIYKVNILNRYCLQNEELQLKQNYYIKETYNSYGKEVSIYETFRKDAEELAYINGEPIYYINTDIKELTSYYEFYKDTNTNEIIEKDLKTSSFNANIEDFVINELYPFGAYNYWANIKLAFNIKIKKVEINGHNCYKIEYSDMHNYYIEKETGLLLKKEQILKNDEKSTMSTDYEYIFGEVTNEQVSKDILLKYVERQKSM